MKKLTLILILTTLLFSAGLSPESLAFKDAGSKLFTTITENARLKWPNKPDMVIFEINKQCHSVVELAKILKSKEYHERTMLSALVKWSDNYTMVVYEYRKQNRARLELLKLK